MLRVLTRSPAAGFGVLALATFLAVALAALWVSHLPGASFVVRATGDGLAQVTGIGAFPADQPATFIDRQGQARLTASLATLAVMREPRGTPAENAAHYAARGTAARLLREDGMRLRLPDGRLLPASATAGGFAAVRPGAWLALGVGLVAVLAGFWVLVLRPREWAAHMFLLSGLGLLLAMVTIAAQQQESAAMDAGTLFWLTHGNFLAGHVFGLSLVALFARYPDPLVPRPVLAACAVLLAGLWFAGLADPWTNVFATHLVFVQLEGLGIVVFALLQGWRSRRDPALRASFRLIGLSLLFCLAFFSAVNLIPQLIGRADVLSVPVSSASFLLFYLALTVAVARYRLFDLGSWAVKVAVAALVVICVLAIDFLLVLATGGTWTLSLAFLAAAIAWLPVREVMLRRADRRRGRRDSALLRGANEVAFALAPAEQDALWNGLLDRQFAPLRTEPCDCADVEIRADGRVLAVPSPLGGRGTALHFAGQGNRLFSSEDRGIAAELVDLVRELAAARAAYDRGVQAERRRIARDLHDDVGARLMTTLHRGDLGTVHADVREAMADMRLIIDGMSGESRPLADVLADLRHETVNRLALAGIEADWPVTDLFDDTRPLGALPGRVLLSVVRELVSNVIRHAHAGRAGFACQRTGDGLSFTVTDDGCGFDTGREAGFGNGLRNIRKRLEELGGVARFESGPAGSTVEVRLPLPSPEHGMARQAAGG